MENSERADYWEIEETRIEKFLNATTFAVIGASDDESKFEHTCFICYLQKGMKVYPINPKATTVCGHRAYPDIKSVPEQVESISIITAENLTERVVIEAIAAGVKNIWMQPGSENLAAVKASEAAGLNVIYGRADLLEVLSFRGQHSPTKWVR